MAITSRVRYLVIFCATFIVITGITQILQKSVALKISGFVVSAAGVMLLCVLRPNGDK